MTLELLIHCHIFQHLEGEFEFDSRTAHPNFTFQACTDVFAVRILHILRVIDFAIDFSIIARIARVRFSTCAYEFYISLLIHCQISQHFAG